MFLEVFVNCCLNRLDHHAVIVPVAVVSYVLFHLPIHEVQAKFVLQDVTCGMCF